MQNVLRPYAWGSTTAIAELLGQACLRWSGGRALDRRAPGLPVRRCPSRPLPAALTATEKLGLDELIAEDPEHHLGSASVAEFGPRLPFLLKILAAESPLSLQVHPTLAQARAGFAREEAAGVDHADRSAQLQR